MMTRLVQGEEKFNDAAVIHTFLGDAKIGLWVIELEDGKAPRMFADESMLELLGVTEELSPEDCYNYWFSRVDQAEVPRVQEAVARINAMEFAEVHYAYHHPTRGTIYVRCGGTRDPEETRFASLNGFHQDITDLQEISKTTETLRTDNEELLFSLNNLFNSLYRIDPVRKIVYTMRAPADMILPAEMDYDDFLERSVSSVHPDDRADYRKAFCKEHLQELYLSDADQFAREYRRSCNGEYRWVAFQIYFMNLEGKRKWGIFGTRDVHERRSREEKNRQALADACQAAEASINAKVEFLSHMSHDVRTPINQILGMTTLARAVKDDPAQVMQCVRIIEDAGTRLYHLVNEILDISRVSNDQVRLEREATSLREVVDYNIEMVSADAKARDIRLHTSLNVRHDRVLSDRMRLSEIFLNFLTNAIQFSPADSDVTLTVTELEERAGGAVGYRIDCLDHGIGITEEDLPHVFDAFWRAEDSRTTARSGAGLGLAIVRNVAALMNGWVSAKSTVGSGSCFTAVVYLETLPEEDAAASETPGASTEGASQDSEEGGLEGISVLVVEDNEINRDILEELLRMTGAKVAGASNGSEAVAAYVEDGDHYDIILMDIKMPVMDGNMATRRIRDIEERTGRHIPIIALTANNYADDIAESLEAGVDRHMTKPYDQQTLFRTMRTLLAEE